MGGKQVADTNYLLTRNEVEGKRLTQQYNLAKKVLNRTSALPPSIDPASVETVIDIAAGNLVWTLDLVRTPEIRARLPSASPTGAKPVRLYACDLSSAQFPPPSVTDELGITLFEHNVTQRFPPALHGTFDVVNMRLLVMALSAQGWAKALENVRELLKPGGSLILLELDAQWYRPHSAHERWKYDPQQGVDADDWLGRSNKVIRNVIEPMGFFVNLPRSLPSLVEAASYTVVSHTPVPAPVGTLCKTYPSALTADDSTFTAANFVRIFDMITRSALQQGNLTGVTGLVESEERRLEMVRVFAQGFDVEGALAVWVEVVARKN